MKSLTLFALCFALSQSAFAGSWSNVDQFQLSTGANSSAARMSVDASGTLWVAGSAKDSSSVSHWIVRKSTDEGATWTTVDNFTDQGHSSSPVSVMFGATNEVIVSGYTVDNGAYTWLVRRSTDNGSTWSTVTVHTMQTGERTYGVSMTRASSGAWFVYGSVIALDGNGDISASSWLVLKSTDNGSTWSTSDSFDYAGVGTFIRKVAIDSSGNLYSTGYVYSNTGTHSIIRKSTNGGTSWSTLEDYQWSPGEWSETIDLTFDSLGNMFTTGVYCDSTECHWLTRKSTNGGTSFSIIDDFEGGSEADGRLVFFGPNQNIYVVGVGGNSNNDELTWYLRHSTDGGTNWSTLDALDSSNSQPLYAFGGVVDASGNPYTCGMLPDGNGGTIWTIRKWE